MKQFCSSIGTASIINYLVWVFLSVWAIMEAKMVPDSSMFGLPFYQKDTKYNVKNATKTFNSLHLNTEAPEAKHQAFSNYKT